MKPSYRKRFVNAVKRGEVAGLTIDPDNPALAYDSMELGTPPGTRVRFTGYGGHEFQQEEAREVLEVDSVYTVDHVEVGSWESGVSLKEFPGRRFNTVMFEALEN